MLKSPKTSIAVLTSCVMLIAAPFTAKEEGLVLHTYLDGVGIPTACYGETDGIKSGDRFTEDQCNTLFYLRLGTFSYMVDLAVDPEMTPEFHAALTSWAYNVGLNNMRKSTLIKKANSGDFKGACDELLKWKLAGGKPVLLPRRERERKLCLSGIK